MYFTHEVVMDSEGLETFLCVQRTGSVSAAAVALSRTQSAISRRLATLEAQVGMPLFERVGRRLVMSDAGQALLPYAERVAAALADARVVAQQVSTGKLGLLRVAVVGTLADGRLATAIKEVRRRFPEVELQLRTATSSEVSDLVRTGAATVGLRYFTERSRELSSELLMTERLAVACPLDHPKAGRRVAKLATLANEQWLAFPVQERKGEHFARSIFAQFLSRGIADLNWTAIDSLTAQKRLVEAGLGLALLQESAIAEEVDAQRLAVIRVDDLAAEVPLACVTRRGANVGPAGEALLDSIRAAANSTRTTRKPQTH
jgi:DNA-binding transcriptional LysR family regulator